MRPSADYAAARCLDLLYKSAIDPSEMPQAIDGMRDLIGANSASFFVLDHAFRPLSFVASNHDPAHVARWVEHYVAYDPFRPWSLTARPGQWATDDSMLDPRRSPQREYVNDFATRAGIRWLTGGKVMQDETGAAFFTVQRPHDADPFDHSTLAILDMLFPHVQRVSRLLAAMPQSLSALVAAEAGVHALAAGVCVVDRAATVRYANPAATELMGPATGLRMRSRQLHFDHEEHQARLRHALRLACNAPCQSSSFTVTAPSGRRLLLRVLPLHDTHPMFSLATNSQAIVFVAYAPGPVGGRHIQQMYGLTNAEYELLELLSQGLPLDHCAQLREVSLPTVRTQLARLLRKTGTNTQSQLIALVRTLPALR